MGNFQKTSHNVGRKKVFASNQWTSSCLTQMAYGELDPDEIIKPHKHPTMEEYFYFIEGNGYYRVSGESYDISLGSYIKTPSNTMHSLVYNDGDILKFVYFGISIG